MKPNRRTIGIITGVVIAIVAAGIGFLRGYAAQDVCTGTGSAGYQFARVCGDDFWKAVGLFSFMSFLFLLGLLTLAISKKLKPAIRLAALGVFLIYAAWVTLFSSSVWNTPYFMAYVYDPSRGGAFDFNCLECRVATPTP